MELWRALQSSPRLPLDGKEPSTGAPKTALRTYDQDEQLQDPH